MTALFLSLTDNIALLLALISLHAFIPRGWRGDSRPGQILTGLILGGVAVVGMLRPVVVAPGLFFDGRTVVLGTGAFVAGPLAGLVAAGLSLAAHVAIGGLGLPVGILTISSSVALGLAWRAGAQRRPALRNSAGLLGLGLAIHLAMLLCLLILPRALVLSTLRQIALPVLTVYPLACYLLGKLLLGQGELARSRRELEASERQMRLLTDNATDILTVVDARREAIYMSPACERILGHPPEAFLGRDLFEFAHPDDRAGLAAIQREHAADPTSWSATYRARHRDGSYLWLESRLRFLPPIVAGADPQLIVITHDVSGRQAMEAKLAEASSIQRAILDTIPDLAWMKDCHGVYLGGNAHFAASCGLTPADIPGKTDAELWPDPAQAAKFVADDARVLASGRPTVVEEPLSLPSGEQLWFETIKTPVFDGGGAVVGTVGIARDATARRYADLEKRRLATAVEQTAESMLILDPDDCILYANPAFERLTGYPRDSVFGRQADFLWGEAISGEEQQAIRAALRREGTWRGPSTWRRRDGSALPLLASIATVHDEQGEIAGFVAAHFDQREPQAMQARLLQAEKMEAIGTLAGGIAHDFNNTLGAILGYAEMATLIEPADPALRRYLGEVIIAANRAKELVRQILSFSRPGVAEATPVAVAPVVTEALGFLRATIPSNVEIRFEDAGADAQVLAGPSQLHQLLLNLCSNSAHALGGAAGEIAIRLERLSLTAPRAWAGPALLPGDYLRLSVADSGPGLDPALLPRVFEPFFTTKGTSLGTGMGLAVVHGIVSSLGGSVEATSAPGAGFRVEILLPRAAPPATSESRGEVAPAMRRGHILVVEDEPQLRDLYERALSAAGHRVAVSAQAEEALASFLADPAAIDLLITDLTMPGLSGAELAQRLRTARPGLPIILVTGYTETAAEAQLQALGGVEVLLKPLSMQTLCLAAGRILATSHTGVRKRP